ncbi:MAG TPA: response regulator, partial [Polyangiales bacterium]
MEQANTALDSARERFLEGQTKRVEDLRRCIAALTAAPDSLALRDELTRTLQALLASAKLFEQTALMASVQRSLVRLSERQAEPLEPSDLHALEAILALLSDAALASAHSGVHSVRGAVRTDVEPKSHGEADAPVQLTQTLTGLSLASLPARLLLICSRPHALRFRELLDDAAIEIVHAADADEAVRMLHTSAPACALLSAEYANLPDIDLVRRLQTDPLGQLGGVYVILPEGSTYDAEFLRQTGADGVLIEPLTKDNLSALVERNKRDRESGLRALRGAAARTVDEIAGYVAEEIRSGIADSLRAGAHERIQLGDTRELMAAAWSAIGRVRSHLAEQSRGRVHFRDDAVRELPSFMMKEPSAPEPEALEMLSGKRVLVADDDPAVLWFFSGLLRESGAQVLQANNGRDALSLARRKQPHLILSDILMPKVDGFALCREVKR